MNQLVETSEQGLSDVARVLAALAQGDPDTARQYFEKALEFDPGFKQASENLELIDKKK